MSAANDAHDQAGLLGVVLERNHDAAALLQGFVFCLVHLHSLKKEKRVEGERRAEAEPLINAADKPRLISSAANP